MGNLHAGHLSLVKKAKENADHVIVSIFVNPLQFDDVSDLQKYPRTLEDDLEKLQNIGADAVFTPTADDLYQSDNPTIVHVPAVTNVLCGASRAGHFDGVSTVVNKLFNLVEAHVAVFGEKDYQQCQVIQKMVDDLCLPISLIFCPTAREETGLAMSSRNGRLSETARRDTAPKLFEILENCRENILSAPENYQTILAATKQNLEDLGFKIDYFKAYQDNLSAITAPKTQSIRLFIAAFLEEVRLIDNLSVK